MAVRPNKRHGVKWYEWAFIAAGLCGGAALAALIPFVIQSQPQPIPNSDGDVSTIETRLTTAEKSITSLSALSQSAIDATKSLAATSDRRQSELEAKIEAVRSESASSSSALRSELSTVTDTLGAVSSRVDSMERSLAIVETGQMEIKQSIAANHEVLVKSLAELSEAFKHHTHEVPATHTKTQPTHVHEVPAPQSILVRPNRNRWETRARFNQ